MWVGAPVAHGTDNPSRVSRSPGGSAANVAAAVAAAGCPARFVGRVGADGAGDSLAEHLRRAGVDVRVQRAGRTATVVVLVDPTGERTMFPDRAAAGELTEVDASWLEGTTVLHVPAYGLLVPAMAQAIEAAARTVRAHGGLVTLDVAATSVVEALGAARLRATFAELAPAVVFANEAEADALGVLDGPPPWTVVVKRGAASAVILQTDGRRSDVPACAVDDVRDTTGAGDAFAGGFLSALTAGADVRSACLAGHAAAATVLRVPGARHR